MIHVERRCCYLRSESFWKYFKKNYGLYLMMVPGLVFLFVYKFAPLYGLLLAFKDFNIFLGNNMFEAIVQSPWVGIENFKKIFNTPEIIRVIRNTIIISLYKLIFLFPLPIILALLLNEIRIYSYKRTIQTLVYMPYFLSWVIVFGLFYTLLGSDGLVNQFTSLFAIESISFLSEQSFFRPILVISEGWKTVGWGTIIFLAAIATVDPQEYEAAYIDGANRFQRMVYITLPGILPVIVLVLILQLGNILEVGFEQVLAFYNPAVYKVGDVIQTYVYRIGLGRSEFSLGTALGMFESIIAFVLIMTCNAFSRRRLGRSIW